MHALPATLSGVGRATARARSSFAGMLRGATLAAGGVTIIATCVAAAFGGWSGSVGALAGGMTVTLVLAAGVSGLRMLLSGADSMAIAVALAVYGVQLSVLFTVFLWVRRLGIVDVVPFGSAAIAATLAWQVGLVAGLLTSRQFMYDDAGRP